MRKKLLVALAVAASAYCAVRLLLDDSVEGVVGSRGDGVVRERERATAAAAQHGADAILSEAVTAIERLSVAPAMVAQTSSTELALADKVWQRFSREPMGLGRVLSDARCTGEINFRSNLLNPGDTYFEPAVRDRFASDIKMAVARLDRLSELKMSIAKEQVLDLAAKGAFKRISGDSGVWRYGERTPANTDSGWHTVILAGGDQFQIQWSDLTWADQVVATSPFLEAQFNAGIIEFFSQHGALDSERRDAIHMYWINGGDRRLRELATTDPAKYRHLQRLIFGK
jgi:hypothetical protein